MMRRVERNLKEARLVATVLAGTTIFPDVAFAQNAVDAPLLSWMAWTWQTATFFILIACALIGMTLWEITRPGGSPRMPGVLGIDTTRGDRLFISLLGSAYIHLAWLGFALGPLWGASIVSVVFALAVFRWV